MQSDNFKMSMVEMLLYFLSTSVQQLENQNKYAFKNIINISSIHLKPVIQPFCPYAWWKRDAIYAMLTYITEFRADHLDNEYKRRTQR